MLVHAMKPMLDDMHLRKIDLADEIFVINPGGYIGTSTRREIEYAHKTIIKSFVDESVLYIYYFKWEVRL